MAQLAAAAFVAGCSSGNGGGAPEGTGPVAKVTFEPGAGATDVNPVAPVSVRVANGTIKQVTLTNANGKQVAGALSPDRTSYKITEALGYGATYTWSGTAIGTDSKPVPIDGKFTTISPKQTVPATINIGDGQEVGIAAPIILRSGAMWRTRPRWRRRSPSPPIRRPRAAGPGCPTTTARGALAAQGVLGAGHHGRVRRQALRAGSGGGNYGDSDHEFVVQDRPQPDRQGRRARRTCAGVPRRHVLFDFACSYGEGNETRNVTRSGIHVVTEKYEDFTMSNPPFYTNARERWAVRISTTANSSMPIRCPLAHKAIRTSPTGASIWHRERPEVLPHALYGDPVEVTGTRIALSAADGDIYDWTIDWATWKSMSALKASPRPSSRRRRCHRARPAGTERRGIRPNRLDKYDIRPIRDVAVYLDGGAGACVAEI